MRAERAAGSVDSPESPHDTAEQVTSEPPDPVLHRRLMFPLGGGVTLLILGAFVAALLLRLVRLDAYVLGDKEASWAYDAWSLFRGRPLPGTEQIPDTAPLLLVTEAFTFFLFGVTDATARFGPALFGIGIIVLLLALRPLVPRFAVAGMVVLAALSPTLVYASRTIDPAIGVAFSTLLLVVSLLRSGHAVSLGSRSGWIVLAGAGAAGALGGGPEGVSALIAAFAGLFLAAVAEPGNGGAVREGFQAIGRSPRNQVLFVLAFVLSLAVLYTRMFSDVGALEGIVTTFADWGRMIASRSTRIPQSFFFYAVLLYEIFALVFAIVALAATPGDERRRDGEQNRISPVLFGGWFAVSLLLFSFASGREAEQAVLVVLPLVVMGGMGLGHVLEKVRWSGFWTSRAGLLPLVLLVFFVGVIAIIMVIARSNDPGAANPSDWPPVLQIFFILAAVVIPAAYLIWTRSVDEPNTGELGNAALLVLALVLALFTIRSATALAFYRADDGTELLAPNVPTQGIRAFVDQVYRLSRDLSVENLSNVDNTGSLGLQLAIGPDVEWPFLWYFRDFPNVRVEGPAGWTEDDDVVVAASPEGMDTAGFVVQQKAFENRTANAYVDLSANTVFGNIFSPDEWYDGFRFLFFREMESEQPVETVAVGYAFRISNQINPNLGPFDLFTQNTPGPGGGLGQLSVPTGIAVSPDGQVIYVVNAGNQRIERYARDGSFLGIWDTATDPSLGLAFQNGQGASDIETGDDGLIYVTDTWNHIVVVLDQEGNVVRQLGQRGVLTDIGDGGDPASEPGLFFGPRGIAVLNDEIYVSDTGNERIQVFSKDGTFLRAFGGFGTGQGELQEPTDIAFGPDGNLYVADSGNGRLVVYTPEGEVLDEIPVESWTELVGADRVNYVAFNQDGILYLTAPARGVLEAYDGEEFVPIEGNELVRPVGVAVAPDEMVLVTDGAESTVIQIVPDLPEGFGAEASPVASPQASPLASPAS
ncbi:MAG TPA: 6-bladed beta-propeller [Thermomicrobiales bacterium]|nr:6-bladed beta-propeller [Thermomicrobiales bacterium]